uniref:DDE Tnp4 domain-containing protein n=1 Tax=Brassica oleracea var. oleracea TaxID=109376 RepID=A0A0D3CI67_BRAOL
MAFSSSSHNLEDMMDETFDQLFDQQFEQLYVQGQEASRMNKLLFMRIVDRLSAEIPYFQQRRDATRRFSHFPLQKAMTAIRKMAYGCPADAVDEYLRLGRAPKVNYIVNGHEYHLAYYLTYGIYPKWANFVQSIPLPQGPKASLFATHQEVVRKDVERAFGVLQTRFVIVKNPALLWDKIKIEKITRACIILHNMIVEDERDGYTQFDVSVFTQPESNRSSQVDFTNSTYMHSNLDNMMSIHNRVCDNTIHQQLKVELVEHIWQKFGTNQDFN